MSNTPLFPPETRHDPARGRRVVQTVTCRECGATHEFNVNTRSGGMADDTIVRKAGLLGWRAKRSGRVMTCPACLAREDRSIKVQLSARKLDTDPDLVRRETEAALGRPLTDDEFEATSDACRLEAVLDSGAVDLDHLRRAMDRTGAGAVYDALPFETEKPTMKETTTAPRSPSRDDKRRILDKLSECYASEEIGYAADWSDRKLAEALNVPEAWVRDLRVEFHGDNGDNEANSAAAREFRRALNELRKDLTTAEKRVNEALGTLAQAEREVGSVKARLDKLENGGLPALRAVA
jgi:hypothetical protein